MCKTCHFVCELNCYCICCDYSIRTLNYSILPPFSVLCLPREDVVKGWATVELRCVNLLEKTSVLIKGTLTCHCREQGRCTSQGHALCEAGIYKRAAQSVDTQTLSNGRSVRYEYARRENYIFRCDSGQPATLSVILILFSVNFVSRESWAAAIPRATTALTGSVQVVIIHHTALPKCTDLRKCQEQLASIQANHMEDRSFDDIGYNFLVADDGTLFEGRGWGVVGAHAKGHNYNSLGIAFMGNYMGKQDEPSVVSLNAVKKLIQFGVSKKFVDDNYDLKGHGELTQTECPGTHLYKALSQLKSTS
uniref:Peptidoglycan recognition protein 5 n=1 Tax=Salarias fasciatus TaxID=181472 RepID=A0A672IPV3_SALFA